MTAELGELVAGRAYLAAAGWRLERGYWLDPEPELDGRRWWRLYPDSAEGVARAVERERRRW